MAQKPEETFISAHHSERILRVKQVAEKLSVSVNNVWNRANPKHGAYDPNFPLPFKVSANVTGWLESEINAYILQLAKYRLQGQ